MSGATRGLILPSLPLRIPTPYQSSSSGACLLSSCNDRDLPASAMMYSVVLLARKIMPRFAFNRKAPSWANAVREKSLDDDLAMGLPSELIPIAVSSG